MVMLVDNGSSRAASTLSLRVLCSKLEQKLGRPVLAVSMAHSDKAPLDELGGTPAVLFAPRLMSARVCVCVCVSVCECE